MTPDPHGELTDDEIAYYKRSHACGDPTEPWDGIPHQRPEEPSP